MGDRRHNETFTEISLFWAKKPPCTQEHFTVTFSRAWIRVDGSLFTILSARAQRKTVCNLPNPSWDLQDHRRDGGGLLLLLQRQQLQQPC